MGRITSAEKSSIRSSNCFDLMRVIAASAVLYSHSFAVIGHPEPRPIAGQTIGSLAVALFFGISGFLVCQSWRSDPSLYRFTMRRALRIMPGLFVVVAFTALIVGPIFTSVSLESYFSGSAVFAYFPQTLLFVSVPGLPGLFETNPLPHGNNASLWTLRYEVLMYAFLALGASVMPKSTLRSLCTGLLAAFALSWLLLTLTDNKPYEMPAAWRIGMELHGDRLCSLGAYFFSGCVLSMYFDRLRLSPPLTVVLIGVCVAIPSADWVQPLLWFAIPYGAITFAYKAPAAMKSLSGYDYSYGIYVYAFPIQQIVAQSMTDVDQRWFSSLMISAVLTFALAGLSWHLVEKPALGLKSRLIEKPSVKSE